MVFFGLNTWVLAAVLGAIMAVATVTGLLVGRAMAARSDHVRESYGVLQGALIGFMGLVLAFGLSLAVGRYESRRADVVAEANAIGTTYLRAQTLAEPMRTESLALLRSYTEVSIAISDTVPGTPEHDRAIADSGSHQDRLWALAGRALDEAPVDSAPRLYVETLNEMFDAQTDRVYRLSNRVPTAVLVLEVAGAAIAIAALALHLATFGRGVPTVLIASVLVTVLLVVTFDLDRPTRGLIRVPPTPLVDLSSSMTAAPAATAPGDP
ncbi:MULTISPECIES: bestrophin-like domain [unclassified Geodermatophilus]